jgi:hypothetical protein
MTIVAGPVGAHTEGRRGGLRNDRAVQIFILVRHDSSLTTTRLETWRASHGLPIDVCDLLNVSQFDVVRIRRPFTKASFGSRPDLSEVWAAVLP